MFQFSTPVLEVGPTCGKYGQKIEKVEGDIPIAK